MSRPKQAVMLWLPILPTTIMSGTPAAATVNISGRSLMHGTHVDQGK